MTGSARNRRLRSGRDIALAALMLGVLTAGATSAVAETRDAATAASETGASDQLARIMSREQAAFDAVAAERIERLAGARAAASLTLAARQAAPDLPTPDMPVAKTPARLDFAALDRMPPVTGDAQFACLATAIYFESRGEPLAGQIGVAEVVLNRVDSPRYPSTICGVTMQGAGGGGGCQFSYACDGRSDVMTSALSRARAEKIARMMLDGRPRDVTDGATNFHATYVRPSWSRSFTRTAAIGAHVFYRQPTLVAQR